MRAFDPDGVVARAESYPYDLREEAFVFRAGQAHPFEDGLLGGRTAVLAIGSDGAPQRLLSKLAVEDTVPVLAARFADHAVVYAASLTSYGSVPATFVEAPGATALVAVTFLTDDQIERMHTSDTLGRNYELIDVTGHVEAEPPWASPGRVLAYRSLLGPLRVNHQPLRLAEVPTVGTRYGAAYQSGLLTLLHHRFGRRGEDYPAFVRSLVEDPARRRRLARALAAGLTTGRQRGRATS